MPNLPGVFRPLWPLPVAASQAELNVPGYRQQNPIVTYARSNRTRGRLCSKAAGMALVIILTAPSTPAGERAQSEWVYPGPNGKLVYRTTASGDRIMDFSHAGYMGGGVALPVAPVKRILQPPGTNDVTAAIQRLINEVAAMKSESGFRGDGQRSGGADCGAELHFHRR